jgi:hypothetical protein
MANMMTKKTEVYRVDSEHEATDIVEDYKARANREGYTVTKTKVDYKSKKDRKTGELTEEWWVVEVTVAYDI